MVRFPDCTSGFDLFALAELDEDLAELNRLLYVATTRAADYLILSSGLEDLDETKGPWLDLLRRQFDSRPGPLAIYNCRERPPWRSSLRDDPGKQPPASDNSEGEGTPRRAFPTVVQRRKVPIGSWPRSSARSRR